MFSPDFQALTRKCPSMFLWKASFTLEGKCKETETQVKKMERKEVLQSRMRTGLSPKKKMGMTTMMKIKN